MNLVRWLIEPNLIDRILNQFHLQLQNNELLLHLLLKLSKIRIKDTRMTFDIIQFVTSNQHDTVAFSIRLHSQSIVVN